MTFDRKGVALTEDSEGNLISEENALTYDGEKYFLGYLNDEQKKSKGGNSSVFSLTNENSGISYAIKISKYSKPYRKTPEEIRRRYGRFIEEISILNELKERGNEKVISIQFNGILSVSGKELPFYVMEKADTDLKEYIFKNKDIDAQEKVKFCINIFEAIDQLHEAGYYHRDIKPDNILLFIEDKLTENRAIWKIGDLGLARHRDKDYDDIGEKIGPFGWLSPEAANKFLTEKAQLGFDCTIDSKSDVFQLGKLFWFIFLGNIPVGQITQADFNCDIYSRDYISSIIQEMLSYAKPKRLSMPDLRSLLGELKTAYAV